MILDLDFWFLSFLVFFFSFSLFIPIVLCTYSKGWSSRWSLSTEYQLPHDYSLFAVYASRITFENANFIMTEMNICRTSEVVVM